jgi:hypothetical protein
MELNHQSRIGLHAHDHSYSQSMLPHRVDRVRPFLQSSELGLPHPSVACGRGGGGPSLDEGTDTGTLDIYVLCGPTAFFFYLFNLSLIYGVAIDQPK